MLARRLRLSRQYFSMSKGARKLSSEHFFLTMSVSEEGQGGCAAAVSKKIAYKAVDRHRLKRRMLVVMRAWCRADRALIVHARSGAAALPFRTIVEELGVLLSRAER